MGTRPNHLRVALAATRAFPDLGGIESHLDHIAPRLARRGWNLDVIVTDRTGKLPIHGTIHDVPVRRYRAYPRTRDYYFSPGLFVAIMRGRYDLVHVHGVNSLAPPLAMLAAIVSRTPFVVTFHSGGANSEFRRRMRSTQWRVLGLLLRRAERLIGVSASEAATFAAVVGPRVRVDVIPNGTSDMVAPADVVPDPDLILSVGRLERYKGHHLAIGALPHLLARRPGVRLRILGTGPYAAELREISRSLDVEDRVEITSVPPDDRQEMARQLATAGAVTLLSDYEAHPVAVLEALSLGRPVVVRRNSGMVDLIDRNLVDGVPDHAGDTEIADALDSAMGRSATDAVSLPSWDDCADAIHRVLEDVATPRRHSAVRLLR